MAWEVSNEDMFIQACLGTSVHMIAFSESRTVPSPPQMLSDRTARIKVYDSLDMHFRGVPLKTIAQTTLDRLRGPKMQASKIVESSSEGKILVCCRSKPC